MYAISFKASSVKQMVEGNNDELSHDSKETSHVKEEFCVVAIFATSINWSARLACIEEVTF
jgi:hypothetical protein